MEKLVRSPSDVIKKRQELGQCCEAAGQCYHRTKQAAHRSANWERGHRKPGAPLSMNTICSFDPGKASTGWDCGMPRKCRRAKLSLRSSNIKTLSDATWF